MSTVRVGEFEWDDAKARANVRKHGVTFEEAMTVFLDDLAVPFEEGQHPDRLVLVGESRLGRTILVVFIEARRKRYHSDHQRQASHETRAESLCRRRLNRPSVRCGRSPRSTFPRRSDFRAA